MQSLHGDRDLAGPRFGAYEEVEKVFPQANASPLGRKEMETALPQEHPAVLINGWDGS